MPNNIEEIEARQRRLNEESALEEACRAYHEAHSTGAGGMAFCICGAPCGGSDACNGLRDLREERDELSRQNTRLRAVLEQAQGEKAIKLGPKIFCWYSWDHWASGSFVPVMKQRNIYFGHCLCLDANNVIVSAEEDFTTAAYPVEVFLARPEEEQEPNPQ